MKLPIKYKNREAQKILRLISIESSRVCFIFVNKLIFLSSNLLRGYFFYQRNGEQVQRKVHLVGFFSVHRKCRLFPLFLRETISVSTCTIMRFLYGATKISLFGTTQTTNPHVNYIFIFTVQMLGDDHWGTIHRHLLGFIYQRALSATWTITFLIGGDFVIRVHAQ